MQLLKDLSYAAKLLTDSNHHLAANNVLAAAKLVEEKLKSTNTGSTCASQIADEMDCLIKNYSVYWTNHLAKLKQWSRQLRTCQ